MKRSLRTMKLRILKSLSTALASISLLHLAVFAQSSGPYSQTCQRISMRGSTLKAKCQTSNGRWHSTSLQNFDQCNGGIVNDNGNLRCGTEGNRGWYHGQNDRGPNGTPSGSYTQSCQDIRTSGNTLEANCSMSNGDWKRASLQDFNLCNGEIVNDNGRLRCNR
jgi:hypothetical protein